MSDSMTQGLEFIDQVSALCSAPKVPNAMQQSADAAKVELGQMMQANVSPDGTPYVPNAPLTIALKGHSHALFETNQLYESVVGNGSGHVEEVRDDGYTLGTGHEKDGKPIAGWMQSGNKKVPARPFIGATENMGDVTAEAVADDLIQQIAGL